MKNQNGSGNASVDADGTVPNLAGRFGVAVNWIDRIAVLTASGDLDMLTAPALTEAIQAATGAEPAALIVDLAGVEFLGSAGMTVLIAAYQNMAPTARFAVVAEGPATRRPLNVVGVDTIVTVYRTLDEALADST